MTRLSVIIPVFNGAATIGRALASLRAQTMTDFEALIVNDGSTDETETLVQAVVGQDPRFRYETLGVNKGVSFARNHGLALAQGTWVALLDADDWFEPERLEKLWAAAEAQPEADVLFDELLIFDHATNRVIETTHFCPGAQPTLISSAALFQRDTPFVKYAIGFAHPMIRRSFLEEKGLRYDETLRLSEDFALLAEIALRGGRLYALPFAAYVYVHRLSPSSGAVSPFSRSVDDYAQIVDSCDRLIARYAAAQPATTRRAMARRRRLFERLVQARRCRLFMRQKAWGLFTLRLLARPDVVLFVLKAWALRWIRRRTPRLNACCR